MVGGLHLREEMLFDELDKSVLNRSQMVFDRSGGRSYGVAIHDITIEKSLVQCESVFDALTRSGFAIGQCQSFVCMVIVGPVIEMMGACAVSLTI